MFVMESLLEVKSMNSLVITFHSQHGAPCQSDQYKVILKGDYRKSTFALLLSMLQCSPLKIKFSFNQPTYLCIILEYSPLAIFSMKNINESLILSLQSTGNKTFKNSTTQTQLHSSNRNWWIYEGLSWRIKKKTSGDLF